LAETGRVAAEQRAREGIDLAQGDLHSSSPSYDRIYCGEHEMHHTLVILNPSAALRINSVKDIVI